MSRLVFIDSSPMSVSCEVLAMKQSVNITPVYSPSMNKQILGDQSTPLHPRIRQHLLQMCSPATFVTSSLNTIPEPPSAV